MTASPIVEAVFLDTEVFEAASFNLASTSLTALSRHLVSGRLRLVSTDITTHEVSAHIKKGVARELEAHRKFRRTARVLRSSSRSETAGALVELDAAAITADLRKAFDDYLEQHEAEVIDTSELEAGPVFAKYFTGSPPFGSGDKKSEFPDAFVIEALIEWTEVNQEDLLVVSGDELLRAACDACTELHAKPDLVSVLDHVASDDKKLADFVRAQLVAQAASVGQAAKSEFEELGFYVEDEWGDVEVEVTKVDLDGEPEILEISTKEATAQMTFKALFYAHLSYDDSDTGIYDAEEGRMLFVERKHETLGREEDLVVEVKVAFEAMDVDTFQVVEIELVEPAVEQRFRTSKMEGWPWK